MHDSRGATDCELAAHSLIGVSAICGVLRHAVPLRLRGPEERRRRFLRFVNRLQILLATVRGSTSALHLPLPTRMQALATLQLALPIGPTVLRQHLPANVTMLPVFESPQARAAGASPLLSVPRDTQAPPSSGRIIARTPSVVYEEGEAIEFARLAQLAYCPPARIEAWDCPMCASLSALDVTAFQNSSTDTQAFVAYMPDSDRIMISFRGSVTRLNWILNFDFFKTDAYPHCDGCRVHSGFYRMWTAVEARVTAAVKRLVAAHPSAKIYLVGHSLGGAMAALAAAHLTYSQNLTVSAVWTYGEPRAGNDAFRRFYNQQAHVSWRVTHWKDPVPHLPLMAMGFRHISTEVFYSENSSAYTVCDGSGEDPACANGVGLDLFYASDHCEYLTLPVCHPICEGLPPVLPASGPARNVTASPPAGPKPRGSRPALS